tara:strand:+ start:249 stop:491 length:243 start_codon:yes stop_codon:yes gene_type:complete
MKFKDIEEEDNVYPGEYLLHKPTRQIVVCGAYMKTRDKIKALANGRLLIDKIAEFQKLNLTTEDRANKLKISRCKGCSSK